MIEATAAALILLAIGCLWYGPWQGLCTDLARQVLFEKRDAIFDLAASGRLNFNDENYRVIRDNLNKTIRYAHELTLWRHVLMARQLKKSGALARETDVTRAVQSIPDIETRELVHKLVFEGYQSVIGMMFLKSPLILALALPVVALLVFVATILSAQSVIVRSVAKTSDAIQLEAQLCS